MQAVLDTRGTIVLTAETDFEQSYLRLITQSRFRAAPRDNYCNGYLGISLVDVTNIHETVLTRES